MNLLPLLFSLSPVKLSNFTSELVNFVLCVCVCTCAHVLEAAVDIACLP